MTEINVVKKQNSVWPWLLGILLAGLLVWGVVGMLGVEPETPAVEQTQP